MTETARSSDCFAALAMAEAVSIIDCCARNDRKPLPVIARPLPARC